MGLSILHLSLIAQCISPCFIGLWSLAIGYSSPLQVSFIFNIMMYGPSIFVGSIHSQSHSFESKPFKFIPNNHLHCIRMFITSKNTKKWNCSPNVDFGQQLTFWSTLTKVNPNFPNLILIPSLILPWPMLTFDWSMTHVAHVFPSMKLSWITMLHEPSHHIQ